MSDNSLVVVGAGVFGLSTALAWKKKHPAAVVSLIDFTPSIEPASLDTAKIIRSAYPIPEYVELATEARDWWQSLPPFSSYWHGPGWIVVHAEAPLSITKGTALSQDHFRREFPEASLAAGIMLTEDPTSGWVDATQAIRGVLRTAIDIGVEYILGEVTHLLGSEGACQGVQLRSGRLVHANSTVLAMGHWTPDFLGQSNIDFDQTLCQRAGVAVLGINLNESQYQRYQHMRILAVPGLGEIMPPTSDRVMKINNAISFVINLSDMREPLTATSPYFEENAALLRQFIPELSDAPVAFRRYCYDCVTISQDFVITAAPGQQKLFLAFGGSFHGWKFLPNIGDYIVQLVEGELCEAWKARWSPKRGGNSVQIHEEIVPRRTHPSSTLSRDPTTPY